MYSLKGVGPLLVPEFEPVTIWAVAVLLFLHIVARLQNVRLQLAKAPVISYDRKLSDITESMEGGEPLVEELGEGGAQWSSAQVRS